MTGKTELAIEFSKRFLADSNHAFFVDANSIGMSLQKIYSLIKLELQRNCTNLAAICKHIITQDINSKILFVIDNLNNDLDDLFEDLPKENALILITTRNLSLNIKNSTSIYLDNFSEQESLNFLELKLKLQLADDEDKEFQIERIQRIIKSINNNRLYYLLQLIKYFENNEFDSFDEILDKFEEDFKIEFHE